MVHFTWISIRHGAKTSLQDSIHSSLLTHILSLVIQVQPVPHEKEKFLVWTTTSSQWRTSWSWRKVEPYWRLEHMKVNLKNHALICI